ncbi:hypothetical protein BaRGS_00026921 [Batillaria attramentaria]|uniref:Uncharacterized protein n=1 Tax=Batillaria attramentaria TaxID=370345 RepID=A0ABD0K3B7_9CAEN
MQSAGVHARASNRKYTYQHTTISRAEMPVSDSPAVCGTEKARGRKQLTLYNNRENDSSLTPRCTSHRGLNLHPKRAARRDKVPNRHP